MLESVSETELVAKNLLLFVSALIPKALASLLTSCVIELAKPENVRTLTRQTCASAPPIIYSEAIRNKMVYN